MINLPCVILVTFVLFEIALCENYGLPSGDVCLDFKANLNSEFAKDCFQNLDECQQVMELLQKGIRCDPECGERERCVMVHGKLQCNCTKGYRGKDCSIDTNQCDSNPCQNGATCIDELNNYNCSCVSGFTGKNCETGCKPEWEFFQNKCYYFENNQWLNWASAEAYCVTQGGHLASIHSHEENNFIKNLMNNNSWIGAEDFNKEGNFRWSDGSDFSFSDWFPMQPDDTGMNEDCAVFRKQRISWNDLPCDWLRNYVCKM